MPSEQKMRSCTETSKRRSSEPVKNVLTRECRLVIPINTLSSRPPLTVSDKRSLYLYEKPQKPAISDVVRQYFRKSCNCSREKAKQYLFARLPIVNWLFLNYNIKKAFTGDLVSGLTVGVMHIPQGMGYAMLANLDPICGIYMAFFPVLIYTILCTSMHCSVGTLAVISIMTGKITRKIATPHEEIEVLFGNDTDELTILYNKTSSEIITHVEVASIIAFGVGMWKILFALLDLGSLCVYLSDMTVSGFMTGAACHVFTSQIPYLLGIKITSYKGPLQLVYTYVDIFRKIPNANPVTVAVSAVCLVVLIINDEVLQPIIRKYSMVPLPMGLVLVICGTLVSSHFALKEEHSVRVVDNIPAGLPSFRVQRFDLLPEVLVDTFILSVLSFMFAYSLSTLFAKRSNYSVDGTQELYALGIANIFGSFFPCGPLGTSLSRSMVQFTAGGVTQAASFFSCLLLLQVLLFIGPFFEPLPVCVLGSIILVALKGLLLQVTDCINMWKVSRTESFLWVFTFMASVLIDIDYGLVAGIIMSLILVIGRSQTPRLSKLGRVTSTDVYLELGRYRAAKSVPGFCILQVCGTLHFANQEGLTKAVIKKSGLDPCSLEREKRLKELERGEQLQENLSTNHVHSNKREVKRVSFRQSAAQEGKMGSEDGCSTASRGCPDGAVVTVTVEVTENKQMEFLVLDLGGVGIMDVSASKNLIQLCKDYEQAGITVALCGLTEPLLEAMAKYKALDSLPQEYIFHSVHDAVLSLSASKVQKELSEMTRC